MRPQRSALSKTWFYLNLPEGRLFWFMLPALAGVAVLVTLATPSPFSFVALGLVAIAFTIGLMNALQAARMNYETSVERHELQSVVAGITDAIVAYDQDFRVFFFNPAAERLFGVKIDEAIGSVIDPKDAESPNRQLLTQVVFPSLAPSLVYRTKAGQFPQVADISFSDPLRELRVTTVSIPTKEGGRTAGFMKIINDRTQEVSLLKSKTEFITVASHQLRTPITEINWGIQAIAADPNLPDSLKDVARQTNASAKKVEQIVEDLLSVTKMEEGRFGYNFEQRDLIQFFDTLLSSALPQIERAGLKLYFDRPKEPLPPATFDANKLSMAVSNILDNAVRYNVQNGQIVVTVRPTEEGRFAEVSIKDSGIGIPPDEIDKLFSKFFRASNVTKFQADGSGLGLYIVKNIVQAHGGRIWVESEPNRGTAVVFTIPLDPMLVPSREVVIAG
jgi:signal transduction histidine kinase